jgi:hypothetical protein
VSEDDPVKRNERGNAALNRYEPAFDRLLVACAELGAWALETAADTAEWLVAKTRKHEGT